MRKWRKDVLSYVIHSRMWVVAVLFLVHVMLVERMIGFGVRLNQRQVQDESSSRADGPRLPWTDLRHVHRIGEDSAWYDVSLRHITLSLSHACCPVHASNRNTEKNKSNEDDANVPIMTDGDDEASRFRLLRHRIGDADVVLLRIREDAQEVGPSSMTHTATSAAAAAAHTPNTRIAVAPLHPLSTATSGMSTSVAHKSIQPVALAPTQQGRRAADHSTRHEQDANEAAAHAMVLCASKTQMLSYLRRVLSHVRVFVLHDTAPAAAGNTKRGGQPLHAPSQLPKDLPSEGIDDPTRAAAAETAHSAPAPLHWIGRRYVQSAQARARLALPCADDRELDDEMWSVNGVESNVGIVSIRNVSALLLADGPVTPHGVRRDTRHSMGAERDKNDAMSSAMSSPQAHPHARRATTIVLFGEDGLGMSAECANSSSSSESFSMRCLYKELRAAEAESSADDKANVAQRPRTPRPCLAQLMKQLHRLYPSYWFVLVAYCEFDKVYSWGGTGFSVLDGNKMPTGHDYRHYWFCIHSDSQLEVMPYRRRILRTVLEKRRE